MSWIRRGEALMEQSRDRFDPAVDRTAERVCLAGLDADPRSTAAMLGLARVRTREHAFAEGRRWAEHTAGRRALRLREKCRPGLSVFPGASMVRHPK